MLFSGDSPKVHYEKLKGTPRYVECFIAQNEVVARDIKSEQAVLIVGTYLSGIDAAALLLEKGHKGKVVLASRYGLLPSY
mmetsp:Transcript_664/g.371  ORF Transcript_664/g.371 Transcript_664/m.371 type:complete len:80 (-) Transcript_664:808-1047(-)